MNKIRVVQSKISSFGKYVSFLSIIDTPVILDIVSINRAKN